MIKIGKLQMNWPDALISLLVLSGIGIVFAFGFSRPAIQVAIFLSAIAMVLQLFNLITAFKSGDRTEWLDRAARAIGMSAFMIMLTEQLNGSNSWAPAILLLVAISLRLFFDRGSPSTP